MKKGYSILFPNMADKEFLLIETSNLHISTGGLFIIATVHLLFLNCLSFCNRKNLDSMKRE
jgi:hypothetical protein